MRFDERTNSSGYPLDNGFTSGVRLRTSDNLDFSVEVEIDTRIASARRRTKPLREGLVGLQLYGQYSSATVTNPDLIPADTNANL